MTAERVTRSEFANSLRSAEADVTSWEEKARHEGLMYESEYEERDRKYDIRNGLIIDAVLKKSRGELDSDISISTEDDVIGRTFVVTTISPFSQASYPVSIRVLENFLRRAGVVDSKEQLIGLIQARPQEVST